MRINFKRRSIDLAAVIHGVIKAIPLIVVGIAIGFVGELRAQSTPSVRESSFSFTKEPEPNTDKKEADSKPKTPPLNVDERNAFNHLRELGVEYQISMSNEHPFVIRELDFRQTPHPCLLDLARLPGVERLSLVNCEIGDDEIAGLPDTLFMWDLDLESTQISDEGIAGINRWYWLRKLSLAKTNVTSRSLAKLAPLWQLKSLNLSGTKIDDSELIHLCQLQALEQVELRQTAVASTGLEFVVALRKLRELDLTDTHTNDVGLEYIDQAPQLANLQLNGTHVTDAGIKALSGDQPLQFLAIGRSRVTPAVLPSLKKFTELRILDLEGLDLANDLSGLASLATLTKLTLHSTSITDQALETLPSLKGLSSLSLAKTKLQGGGLHHLAKLPQLRELTLDECPLKSDALEGLSQLSGLHRLELRDTPLHDDDLRHLTALVDLQELDCTGVKITDAAVPTLLQLPGLQLVCLGETSLSDDGFRKLEDERPFCRIIRTRQQAMLLAQPDWKTYIPKTSIADEADVPAITEAAKVEDVPQANSLPAEWDAVSDESSTPTPLDDEARKWINKKVFLKEKERALLGNEWVDRSVVPFPATVKGVKGEWLHVDRFWVRKQDVMDTSQALDLFSEQIREKLSNARAWSDRGCVWIAMKNYDKAIEDLSESIRLDPKVALTWNNRGTVWRKKDDLDAALSDYNEAIRRDPKCLLAFQNRGNLKLKQGQLTAAIEDYNQAIELSLEPSNMYSHRAAARLKLHEYAAAYEDLREAMRRDATNAVAFKRAAWSYATCPDEKFRDGTKAVELAKRGCELTRWKDATQLDALAAAHATAGNWTAATEHQQQAIEMTRNEKLKQAFQERLELYKAQKPYREEP